MGIISWLSSKLTRAPGKLSAGNATHALDLIAPPALYNQHNRIGGELTPGDVSAILREADSGYVYRLVDLFNESRQKDCHLQSVLWTREMAVAQMRPTILPGGTNAEDKKAADWTSEWIANFGTCERFEGEEPKDLRTLIAHMQGAHSFGYAVAETLNARDGGYIVPIGAVPVSPRRFAFSLADGRLHFWDVFGGVPYPGTDLQASYPGRFIQFQPRVNGDVESREGLARVLVWAALFRNWSMGDWMKLAEVAWKPWRVGYYTKGTAGREDVAALVKALEMLTTAGVAWLPDSTRIDVEWPKMRGDAQHAVLASFMGKEMSKAVLGQTMTTEDGSSLGQAKVHNEVRHDIRDGDATGVEACLRRQLIAPAVRLNFGKNVAIPILKLHADVPVNLLELSGAVSNFAKAGLAIPAKWARATAGIPDPKPGEELLGDRPSPKDGAGGKPSAQASLS